MLSQDEADETETKPRRKRDRRVRVAVTEEMIDSWEATVSKACDLWVVGRCFAPC
jgi:hypothetical protein